MSERQGVSVSKDKFFEDLNITDSNSTLRKLVVECKEEEIAPKYILDELCVKMLLIAREGLVNRGRGEEVLLDTTLS